MIKRFFFFLLCFSSGLAGPVFAQKICPFKGHIDFVKKELRLDVQTGHQEAVSLNIVQASPDNYQLHLSLDHLRFPGFDISTQLQSLFSVVVDQKRRLALRGAVLSQYTLINYKPVQELSGNFRIKDRVLFLESVSLGGVTAQGTVELSAPFKVNLSMGLSNIPMSDFLKFWGADEHVRSQGEVNGDIRIQGAIDNPLLRGSFTTLDGMVQDLAYDTIVLNVEGVYPLMQVKKSSVAKSDGMTFNLEGTFDLANREHFSNQIAALKKLPVVSQDHSTLEWTLKRHNEEDQSKTTEFKYFLRKANNNATTAPKETSDLLGVERSIHF